MECKWRMRACPQSREGGSDFRVARCGAARLASASVATFPAAQEKTRTHTHRDHTSAHKTSTARGTRGAQRAHSEQCFLSTDVSNIRSIGYNCNGERLGRKAFELKST